MFIYLKMSLNNSLQYLPLFMSACEWNLCEFSYNCPQDVIRETVLKVHIHCAKCDQDLQNKLLKHKGKFNRI